VFRAIRLENETIYRYFYETRKNFVHFLKRPDKKQYFVTDWQKSYNDFPEDMRNDDDAKCELHQRVDDLCDRLWDICDHRKDEAEQELLAITTEQWLEDHVGLLVNHYVSLLQMEVDRFQTTCKLLKDYYVAMEGGVGSTKLKLISEGMPTFTRLPLVDIPPTQAPVVAEDVTGDEETEASHSTPSQTTKMRTPEPTATATTTATEERISKIPLISRGSRSTDTSPSRGGERKKPAPKKESKMGTEDEGSSPIPPHDADEKLLHDATLNALQIIEIQNQSDLCEEDSEANVHLEKPPPELTKTNSKDKKGAKGGGGKDKGAGNKTPSKGSKVNIPPHATDSGPVEDASSEEEKEKKSVHEKMSKEYKKAVHIEGHNLSARVQCIREHSIALIKKLKDRSQQMYTDMDNWLGKRFQEEMESISKMCEAIRVAIEEERQLQDAKVLEDKEFFIDDDLHVFKTPTPQRVPSPREDVYADLFTCLQLSALAKQFKEISPDGLLSVKSFITLILDLQLSPSGMEALPEKWMTITQQQVEQLSLILSCGSAYLNWKFLIILLSHPYPVPTQQDLLHALHAYQAHDHTQLTRITKEEYNQVHIWMDTESETQIAESFDRTYTLKQVFFDVFCIETSEGYLLDYVDMLVYFAVTADAFSGLMNALAVVTGTPMFDNNNSNSNNNNNNNNNNINDVDMHVNVDGNMEEEGLNTTDTQTDALTAVEKDVSWEVGITIDNWLRVFNHGERVLGGDHRFNFQDLPPQHTSKEVLTSVYMELGFDETASVPLHLLYAHPIMQEIIDSCLKYEVMDIQRMFESADEECMEM